MTPLVALGMRRTIRSTDLWDCYPEEKAAHCWAAFEPHWEREKQRAQQQGRQPALMSAINGLIGWPFLFAMLAYSWVPTDQLLGPQFLNQLVQYSTEAQYESVSSWQGYKVSQPAAAAAAAGLLRHCLVRCLMSVPPVPRPLCCAVQWSGNLCSPPAALTARPQPECWAAPHSLSLALCLPLLGLRCLLLFLSSVGTALSNSVSMHLSLRLAFRVRAVLTLLIYRKALRIPSKHRQDGRINNLFTSDTQKILELAQQAQAVWTSPVILGVAIWEMYGQVGWSALLGLAVLVAFFPLAGVLTSQQIKYQQLCAAETDKRIILVNELVLGIRVLKYYVRQHHQPPLSSSCDDGRRLADGVCVSVLCLPGLGAALPPRGGRAAGEGAGLPARLRVPDEPDVRQHAARAPGHGRGRVRLLRGQGKRHDGRRRVRPQP